MESSKLKSKVKLKFETLNAATKIEGFDCGDVRLNEFVRDRMLKEQEQGASAVHCAVDVATEKMLAFYTLSSISVDKTELGVKFPYKQVPAIKLGRLAVDDKQCTSLSDVYEEFSREEYWEFWALLCNGIPRYKERFIALFNENMVNE